MSDVIQILARVEKGDGKAAEELMPLVYEELRKLAAAKMTHEHFRENRTATFALVLVLILAIGSIIVWEFSSHHETRLDAIRKKGYPVTLAELNEWYKPVPEAQNNARFYEEAFGLPVLRGF